MGYACALLLLSWDGCCTSELVKSTKVTDVLAACFTHFCNHADPHMQSVGLQGLCCLFSQRPDLLPAFQPILVAGLTPLPPTAAGGMVRVEQQQQLLKSLSDFIESEQARVELLQSRTKAKKDKKAKRSAADEDEDEEEEDDDREDDMGKEDVFAFTSAGQKRYGTDAVRNTESEAVTRTMQQLLPHFVLLCVDGRDAVRHLAFGIVRSLDAQGMIIPRFVVPTFIANLVDTKLYDACVERLTAINERHPEFIRTCLLNGIVTMSVLSLREPGFQPWEGSSYDRVRRAMTFVLALLTARASRAEFLTRVIDRWGSWGAGQLKQAVFLAHLVTQLHFEGDESLLTCDLLNHCIGTPPDHCFSLVLSRCLWMVCGTKFGCESRYLCVQTGGARAGITRIGRWTRVGCATGRRRWHARSRRRLPADDGHAGRHSGGVRHHHGQAGRVESCAQITGAGRAASCRAVAAVGRGGCLVRPAATGRVRRRRAAAGRPRGAVERGMFAGSLSLTRACIDPCARPIFPCGVLCEAQIAVRLETATLDVTNPMRRMAAGAKKLKLMAADEEQNHAAGAGTSAKKGKSSSVKKRPRKVGAYLFGGARCVFSLTNGDGVFSARNGRMMRPTTTMNRLSRMTMSISEW